MIKLYLTKKHIGIACIGSVIIVIGLSILIHRLPISSNIIIESPTQNTTVVSKEDIPNITIHIAGAVKHPGIYQVPLGTSPLTAIAFAGGALANGDLDRINLVKPLKPDQRLRIPYSKKQSPQSTKSRRSKKKTPILPLRISINTADVNEWQALPGIGPVTAKRIVNYRTQHGHIKSIQDIINIKGIGPKTMSKLQPYLRLY